MLFRAVFAVFREHPAERKPEHADAATDTPAGPRPPSAQRWWSRAVWIIPAAGVLELALHFYFARRAPRPDEWSDIRPLVAAWYTPEKAVVVAPQWAEPLARWKFGDALMPIRDVARPDVSRYARAIEVAILGQRSPELRGFRIVQEVKQGRFVVREVENPAPAHVTFDFTDHLGPAGADVRVEANAGSSTACPFTTTNVESGGLGAPPTYPAQRFVCPGQPSNVFVGVTVFDDGEFRARRCIWSHTPAGGAMVTRFRNVPLGDTIQGHAGMGYMIERDKPNPPFKITVLVDGVVIGDMVHVDGEFWKKFEMPLRERARRTGDVEFRVTAPPSASPACFEADSR